MKQKECIETKAEYIKSCFKFDYNSEVSIINEQREQLSSGLFAEYGVDNEETIHSLFELLEQVYNA